MICEIGYLYSDPTDAYTIFKGDPGDECRARQYGLGVIYWGAEAPDDSATAIIRWALSSKDREKCCNSPLPSTRFERLPPAQKWASAAHDTECPSNLGASGPARPPG